MSLEKTLYYYASRNTKDGDYLVTSYTSEASQKKYGGADAKKFKGYRTLDIENNAFCEYTEEPAEVEPVVRSYMKSGRTESGGGKFVLMAKVEGNWVPTQFRTSSYGAANTLMKALVTIYGEMIVVEEDVEFSGGDPLADGVPF